MSVNQLSLIPPDRALPEEVRWAFINCAVDTSLEFYNPGELRRLNDHANGAKFMSDADLQAIDAVLKTRIDAAGGLELQMSRRCPETLAQIAKVKAAR